MPISLDTAAAHDFAAGTPEVKKIVTRRIGGADDRTEPVDAINVDGDEKAISKFVSDNGGLVDGSNGQFTEFAYLIDLPAGQSHSTADTWVIDGEVFKQNGEAIGKDGGTQTILVKRRKGMRAREPRVTGR